MIEYRHYNMIQDVMNAADAAGLLDDDGLGVYRRRADEIFEALRHAPTVRKAASLETAHRAAKTLALVSTTPPNSSTSSIEPADILPFPLEAAD